MIKSGNLAARCAFVHIKSHDKSGDQKKSNKIKGRFQTYMNLLIQPPCLSIKFAPR